MTLYQGSGRWAGECLRYRRKAAWLARLRTEQAPEVLHVRWECVVRPEQASFGTMLQDAV
jgi:hypothetical protein